MFVLLSLSCTALAQTAPVSIAGNLSVSNSIIDNDLKYDQLGSSVVLTYSAVRGDVVPSGTGNKAILGTTEYKDHVAWPKDEYSYYVSPVIDFVNAGNQVVPAYVPEKDLNGNPRVYNDRIDIGAVEYSMIFDRGNGNWNNIAKWNVGRLPTEHDVVTLLNEASVTNSEAVCKSIISIAETGKLLVNPSAQLDVKTTISNTNANKILIKASSTLPNGTLIFRNSFTAPVSATVEMYSMAFVDENLPDDDPAKFNWQFFGIPFRTLSAVPTFGGAWVRKLNEASSLYDKWEGLVESDFLSSFKGYELTQPEEKTYTFSGVLENRDTTIVLSKSAVPYYSGQHLLSNPYTASVNISDMVFGSNTEATVYIYHSGSYADWNEDQENGRLGTGRGQYLAVPQNAANLILPAIPSMQGFVVRATANNGSVTIPYVAASKNTTSQRVMKKVTPHLTVELRSQHVLDRVWLLYEPTASKQFDNGWDGHKLISKDGNAALYANEPAGNLQVNTVADFSDIYLHFIPGKEEFYRLKMINNSISEEFPNLFLIDLHENKIVEIKADTTIYDFSKKQSDKSYNRFLITTQSNSNVKEDDLIRIYSFGDKMVSIHNLADVDGGYAVYDTSGRVVLKGNLKAGNFTTIALENNMGISILRAHAGEARKSVKLQSN